MKIIKGQRGQEVQLLSPTSFTTTSLSIEKGTLSHWYRDEVIDPSIRVVEATDKDIINEVVHPDLSIEYAIDPYQDYGYGSGYSSTYGTDLHFSGSAGLNSERATLALINAPLLLRLKLESRSWQAVPISLGNDTDCYHPIEQKYHITRQLLELFYQFKHPVNIVTKNALILKDLDLLKKLAAHQLLSVTISVNTLDDQLRQILEPKTTSIAKRLQVIRKLSEAGIPVTVAAAPIIPGLNDDDILPLVKKASEMGAQRIHSIVVEINEEMKAVIRAWLHKTHPDKAQKVINKIQSLHCDSGSHGESVNRITGHGVIADTIQKQFDRARRLFCLDGGQHCYNLSLYDHTRSPQLSLFAS